MSITQKMCDDRHKNLWALLIAMISLAAIAVPVIGWVLYGFRSLEVGMERLELDTAAKIEAAKTQASASVRASEVKAIAASERAHTRALKTERAMEVQAAQNTEFRARIEEKFSTINTWMKTIADDQKQLTRAVDRMAAVQERQFPSGAKVPAGGTSTQPKTTANPPDMKRGPT